MDPQEIIIHIYSNDYYLEDDEKVTFSLSIFGGFDTQNSLLNPIKIERERNNIQCPGNCSGLGQCVDNGICECEEGRRGIYCQNKMRLLYYFNAIWATRIYDVYDEDVEYLYFQLPQHHTFDIVLSTNWHTNAVYNMIVSVTDDSYGISGKGRKFMFRCDPQHYNGWYGTDEIITKNNRTIILGCYNLNRGESHGKLYIDLHYHTTPNPTPIATPTPPATPTLAPTQTPFVTPIETAYETPYKTAFQTAYQTPYYTESFTPFVTPYETVSVTPYLTADLTPFQTVSKTPFETFVGTPFITPDVSKAVTPFITPFTTSEETPYSTASETPYETVFQSPFVTFVSTPSFTLKETAFETAYSTPSSTVSNTPYSTLQSTPSVSRTPARTIFVPIDSTSSDGNDDNSQKEHSNKKNNVSSLVGIIVGCLVGLSLLIVLSVVLYRHFKSESSSLTDIENKTEETKIINSDEETYLQTTIETIPQSFIFTTELDDDDDASTDDPFNFYI
ncbi:hypothetical protein TVAG_171330 [Trichomonas vaginalis G3]|uniref:EGF-like domain-containing protein n=1 Tax=Trichomonas vaginalis (strain ATCC PRA-98 / G3) TaxID=412133 RepID=A2GUY6_TRIV3|nr:bifunctional inhibitor/lipid-transfer protein/seed storage 2s albumin superfamily protein family [Trichomonas vaginalis G3]EAX79031.1 hypothetical protein TVAG_171330 [Trichomonas vaginalis G3]KAI5513580.1 bifunctional inhibitor/lipid-transfer protein/seed storage 2s albumin superfamily protein family [Trichomonas vaginalis G3]|eukprot:XP_001291961.1 hypothetical protein [Trichomonas vaginalis G3]